MNLIQKNDMGQRGEESNNLVLHDGFLIKEEDVIKAAKRVGDFGHAEHYMNSLLFHALRYDKKYLLPVINEIRQSYNAYVFELPNTEPASSNNLQGYGNQQDKMAEEVRKRYQEMSQKEREQFLKGCLDLLRTYNETQFTKKHQWIGIYLVVRDRLDGRLSQSDFVTLAEKITPTNWPKSIKISESTMSNLGRHVKYEDRELAYYEMKDNPWQTLCEAYWDIIKQQILTEE